MEEPLADPFNSKHFRDQKKKWDNRLKTDGFKDIESSSSPICAINRVKREKLKHSNTLDFFLHLDWLLTHYADMPKFERKVMELYSDGVFINKITKQVKASDKHVRNVIKRYKHLVKAIICMMGSTDNAPSLRLISKPVSEVTANAEDRVQNKAA